MFNISQMSKCRGKMSRAHWKEKKESERQREYAAPPPFVIYLQRES